MDIKENKLIGWLFSSNRQWHLLVGLFLGVFCGIVATFTAACACEFKDWQYAGGKGGALGFWKDKSFDWLDIAATMIGGIFGEIVHYIIFNTL